jgi:hypothetical protein
MTTSDDLVQQAADARAKAARARWHAASGFLSAKDAGLLTAYAEEQEAKARTLDAQARLSRLSLPPINPVVTHQQQQAQQQSDEAPPTKQPPED